MTRLQEILKRAETWSKEAQDEAAELLLALEEEKVGLAPLSADDLEALARSAEDAREGRFASEEEVREVFSRPRG
jgi:hypothetical protein